MSESQMSKGQIRISYNNPGQPQVQGHPVAMARSLTAAEPSPIGYQPTHHSVVVPSSSQVRVVSGNVGQQSVQRQSHHMVHQVVGQPIGYLPGQGQSQAGVRISPQPRVVAPHGVSPHRAF